jgi:hypothetical protein
MITSRTNILLVLVACGAAPFAVAESETPVEPVGLYQLKSRSTFAAEESARSPFWPIGHVKRLKAADVTISTVPTEGPISPEMFNVTSIALGNPSLAIINGRAYGEGEIIRMGRGPQASAAAQKVRIRVTRIVDGHVTLQSAQGESLTIPLRRPELTERKADDPAELLLEDR